MILSRMTPALEPRMFLTEMCVATLCEPNDFFKPIDYIIAKTKSYNASSNIELDEMDKVRKLAIPTR